VLSIVSDLNENIYQVAVNLSEKWEKLDPSQTTSPMGTDLAPQPHASILVQRARSRDPRGLTFLLQSRLCSQAVEMTSGWGHSRELAVLEPVYQRLTISKGQAISAKWRSLTHSHLSRPPPGPIPLAEQLANAFDETGSFRTTQESFQFVKAVARGGIESIIRLATRLQGVFMVEVTSGDMSLLSEAPGTIFDGARMIDEFKSDDAPTTPGGEDRVAGTTEVGVEKRVCGGPGDSRHVKVLLKSKVVLEKDVVENAE